MSHPDPDPRHPIQKFDKFTERARRVMDLAQEEARGFNHHYIGTEHLLLGLMREADGVAARVLQNLGVDLSEARGAVEQIIGRGDGPAAGPLELVPRAKRSIELALEEARRLRHHYIGTEHLLLGLAKESEGVAAGVLAGLGLTESQLRAEIVQEIARHGGPRPFETVRDAVARALATRGRRAAEPGAAKGNVVTCRIDDRDLDALDALIEAGIRTTRSDAASWLIRAGIDAHQELFAKVYATVDQIRQLRTEAQTIAQEHATGAPAPPSAEEPPAASEGTSRTPPETTD